MVLSGAGMSADSGIQTFRDADGLWEGYDVMEVASPGGFRANPELVLDFYNQRRRKLHQVNPNKGHEALVALESHYDVTVITQNVDDLHERAGSSQVVHLHGELLKARSTGNPQHVVRWNEDLLLGDRCPQGYQLRPHIVWFGEAVPLLPVAAEITKATDILIIIGTSLQVYPAASLAYFAPAHAKVYLIDPNPGVTENAIANLKIIPENANTGVPTLVDSLIGRAT